MKKKRAEGPAPIAVAKGSNGQVELYKEKVRITRKGLWAKLVQGFSGEVEIPVRSITAVELKKAGLLDGHIRFNFPGASERVAALATDPNMVQFGARANESFANIKRLIERRRDDLAKPASAPSSLDEIEKLAGLHKRGILTDEEFSAKKAGLLSR